MSECLWSFPKVYALGHPAIADLLDGEVVVQEKYDGSQFSFGVFDGALLMRSRGAEVYPETVDKLFKPAVATVKALFEQGELRPGLVYRCECIAKLKHNTLCYERVPAGSLVLFDIETAPNTFLDWSSVRTEALLLGLEPAHLFCAGDGKQFSLDTFNAVLTNFSSLGGSLIEGVAIKNYARFGIDGKVLMGKFVSEAFKETHSKVWAKNNPSGLDIQGQISDAFRTPARFAKAVQHLREQDKSTSSLQDIGPCLKLLADDVSLECKEEAMAMWWAWARKGIIRGVQRGFAEWYKNELAKKQFGESDPRTINENP